MNYIPRLLEYCNNAINDTLPNRKSCLYEKLACKRHLNDLAKQDDPEYPYYFSEEAANKRCYVTECLPHTKGKWRGHLIKLEPHQIFMEAVAFGWLKKSNDKRRFFECYFELPRKNGKALDIETPILTTFGWKKHGDLKIGDFVFSPEGKPIKVIASTDHYYGPCFELKFSDGEKIIAHSNHEWKTNRTWFTKKKRGKRGVLPLVETWEIKETLRMTGVRKDIVHSVDIPKSLEMVEKNLPINPYVLGCWLGDGTSNGGQITSADEEIIKNIKDRGYFLKEIYHSGNGAAKQYSFTDLSLPKINGFNRKLKVLNLIKNKHIPLLYLISSKEQRLELLRGLLDTDGTISKAGQISITLTNKKLINDVKTLINSLGIKTTLKEGIATLYGKDCGPRYLLHFFPSENISLFNLSRKKIRQKEVSINKSRKNTKQIIDVKFFGNKVVNCITVEGGMYLAGKSFTPTHNSVETATTGLYMAFVDGEPASEVYAGATTEAQAMMVFQPAYMMTRMTPAFVEYYSVQLTGTIKNPTSVYSVEDMSKFVPIVGNPGDGQSPHCALVDEYHEHPTSILYDAMSTGMGAREQPMLVVITTAGVNTSFPCYDLHLEAIKVLEGTVENDRLFAMIFTIDKDDDWQDFECWKKANPNYGISILEDYLYGKYQDALHKPSQRNVLLTKHLNIWQNAGVGFLDMLKWGLCKDEFLSIDTFIGKECWIGLDLASKIDLAALVFLFKYKRKVININCPKCFGKVIQRDGYNICVSGNKIFDEEDKNDKGVVCNWQKPIERDCVAGFARHYIPEETAYKTENQHYQKWAKNGWLEITEGARTDFQKIEDDIKEFSKYVIIKELTFDPKEASYLIQNIQKWASFECIEFEQGPATISQPMKELEAMVVANEFWHNGDPVYTWCMGNIVKKKAKSGGSVKHYFPTKENDKLKIDSGVATICALGRLMTDEDTDGAYEGRSKSEQSAEIPIIRTL